MAMKKSKPARLRYVLTGMLFFSQKECSGDPLGQNTI
jgi:hypothetical protein